MNARTLLTTLLLAFSASTQATDQQPLSFGEMLQPLDQVPVIELQALDREALLAEDAVREAQPGVAPRFAVPHEVAIAVHGRGLWEAGPAGIDVWRHRIDAPGAVSINLAFSRFRLPEGAELHLFSSDGKHRIRPFTAADNNPADELWTPILQGESMVVELQVPIQSREQVTLEIGSINYGYRGFHETASTRSGACNVDVVCPEGDDWQHQISSVAVISTGGSTFCTGFMVNNVEFDGTPYFMTANHCSIGAGNAASLVTYWNFENSTCRPPGEPGSGGTGDGTLDQFNTGSTFRASLAASDFTLVELFNEPNPAWGVTYAGWDARDQATDWAIAVHHPSTNEKRISFEYDATSITDYLSDTPNPNQTHIRVEDWDLGTTEPGSSGSPLFNPDGQVVGQLHGGYAACSNDDPDWYGRIAWSWDSGGSASARLRDWLDPNNTGTLVISGLGEAGFGLEPDAQNISQCGFTDLGVSIDVTQSGDIDDPVTLSTIGLPVGVGSDFSINPVTPPGASVLTLSDLSAAGTGTFTFVLQGESVDDELSVDMSVTLSDESPGESTVTVPADGAVGVSIEPVVEWTTAGQAFQYELQIATDAAFNDVVYTASSFDSSHEVESALGTSSTYYLRVRASNDCGTGEWSAVVSFSTEALPGDCPMGTQTQSLFYEDFAGGSIPAGWSTAGSTGSVTWLASSAQSHAGGYSMFAQNIASISDQRLTSPEISLTAGAASVFLNFQNWQDVESGGSGCFDGGNLEISTNDGATWNPVGNEHILVRNYDGPIDSGYGNPLSDQQAWCGDPRTFWERYAIDLGAWEGQDVRFRFRFGTDSSVSQVGWYVDSVEVLACLQGDPVTVGGTVEGLEGSGLVLQNNGGDDLLIEDNGAFTFASTLFPGQSYLVTVSEQPTEPAQECSVENDEGSAGEEDVTDILISCQTLGVLEADTDSMMFGEVPEGSSASLNLTMSNGAPAGAMDIELAAMTLTGAAEFQVTGGDCQVGTLLAVADSCHVEIRFSPDAAGGFAGSLDVLTSDGQAIEVALNGQGIELDPGQPEISPDLLSFGAVPTNLSSQLEATVSNVAPAGSADLFISQIAVITGQTVFSIVGSDCDELLAPGESCAVLLRFSPVDETSYSGVLRIVIDGDNFNRSLTGTGAEPEPTIFHDDFTVAEQ
jgi:lysyl endopeptidase